MGYTQDKLDLILRYLHDKHPGKYDNMTTDKIRLQPYHKQVWAHWEALAHFQIGHDYKCLEDAPAGVKWIAVMDGSRKNYEWKNGKYQYVQQITKEDCEGIYGSRVPGTY